MKVLFLTNFYQVQGGGGEEQSCQQVVEGLKQRGHETLVLTSMHQSHNVPVEADGVYKSLYLEMDLVPWRHSITFFTRRKAREKHNLQVFTRVLHQFDPDVIFIWGMWNLSRALASFAESRAPEKVIYRFATYWPTLPSQHEFYWRKTGRKWFSRVVKGALSKVALAMIAREEKQATLLFRNVVCVSAATRDELVEAGIPVSKARIIHTGLDLERYLAHHDPRAARHNDQALNLLYAGRLYPEKGIDTVIVALRKLIGEEGRQNIKLSLAGSGGAEYENHLRQLVAEAELTEYVSFLGWVHPDEMPRLLSKFDVLLLPSVWPEPFSRAVLEGMISGLVVVATRTGGTPEVILDGENGLLFLPSDPDSLATKIALLVDHPEIREKIRAAGRRTVMERFNMDRMMDEMESYLLEVASATPALQSRSLEPIRDWA